MASAVINTMIAQGVPQGLPTVNVNQGGRSFATVHVSGRRLDASTRRGLTAAMEAAWQQGATVVALDFTEVAEVDSVGISILIGIHRRRPDGAKIALCGLNDYARDVFEVTQLFRVFDVFDSVEAVRTWHFGR